MIALRLSDRDGTERIVGLRTNDPDIAARLRTRLAAHVLEGVDVFPNVSLRVGSRKRGRRDVHVVYRRNYGVCRTFDLDTAVAAAVSVVHTLRLPPAGAEEFYARALLRGGTALLVSESFGFAADVHHRQIVAAGFLPLYYSPVLVDPATAELLVPVDSTSLVPEYRRVPLSGALVFAPAEESADHAAVSLSHLTSLVARRVGPTQARDLEALVALRQKVPFHRVPVAEPREAVRVICAL